MACASHQAEPAAEHEAAAPHEQRLRIFMDQVVEPVLFGEKGRDIGIGGGPGIFLDDLVQASDIAASAECFVARAVQNHARDVRVRRPASQLRIQQSDDVDR